MSATLKSVSPSSDTHPSSTKGKHAYDDLSARRSRELIIGLSGPVGSGISYVRKVLEQELQARHYRVEHVKISELFPAEAAKHKLAIEAAPDDSSEFSRIWTLQTIGNDLRDLLGDDVGAQLAMKSIAVHRANDNPGTPIPEIEPGKVAYIIDQLKHPKEVALLRSVYRNLFFMVGVLASYERRKSNLADGMAKHLAEQLIERDRKESEDNGQQLEKTLQHAEFFLSNSRNNAAELSDSLNRFVGLIHGDNGLTPTPKERGMFAAYTASLRSACLSRQVGAAIMDISGNVISSGCNDVPKSGGGLYEPGPGDQRCVFKGGLCYNDKHKNALRDEVVALLIKEGVDALEAARLASSIRSNTRIKDLIEFSRAVHAEMDAIISVARTGSARVEGAVMFTTTYPCHNCARHIVAAGIKAVYFIEPYEKSLAAELHDDSIAQEPAEQPWHDLAKAPTVAFLHFEGVSPHKFTKLFHSSVSRKSASGEAIAHLPDAAKRVPEYLDDYRALEARVVERLEAFAAKLGPNDEGGRVA